MYKRKQDNRQILMQEISKLYSPESVQKYICTNDCLEDRRTEPSREEVADLVPTFPERFFFDWLGTSKADLFMTLDTLGPSVLLTLIAGPAHAVLCDVDL